MTDLIMVGLLATDLPTTSLCNVQNNFQNYLLHGQIDIQPSIIGTEKVPVVTRLAIYRDAYQARLLESLASNYPALKTYLGFEEFQKIGCAYTNAHPSLYRSIRWFGNELTNYLTHYYDNQYPYLAELAEFEWKMTLAFDAADTDVVKLEQMAVIPADTWANMRFTPHPSLQRMNFFWNVSSIWQSIMAEEEPESPVRNSAPTPWILWRNDYINRFYALSDDESWAIDGMKRGLTFGELCEGLCSFVSEEEVGMRAATLLKNWIQSGLLSEIRF